MTKKTLASIEEKIAKDEKNLAKDAANLRQVSKDIKNVTKILKGTGFTDFVKYLRSPWKIFWTNFLAGVFRGLGIIVGMSVVFALLLWFLSQFVDYPLIGEYVKEVQDKLIQYTEQTNYKQNFENIEQLLKEQNKLLK